MLQITPHHRLLLAVQSVDFRKGINGLAALCRQHLQEDPLGGTLFVFANRSRTALKVLVYDGQGFWLCLKRFSKGKLTWWPKQIDPSFSLTASQLQILLSQGNPSLVKIPSDWRSVRRALPETPSPSKLPLPSPP